MQWRGRFLEAAFWWRLAAHLAVKLSGVGEWTIALPSLFQCNPVSGGSFFLFCFQKELLCWSVLHGGTVGFVVRSCLGTYEVGADKVF